MKHYPEKVETGLTKNLNSALMEYKAKRGFVVSEYISQKTEKVINYFKESSLDTAVVAVSGGIDSAIVLYIMAEAIKTKDSPIKKIIPLLLPCEKGVSFQNDATLRGVEACENIGLKPVIVEMQPIVESIRNALESQVNTETNKWAVGQLVSYARTPVLYYMTSLMSANESSSVICGTTNLDEGSYLGYIGKASDGMVDVQVISDIHKSEVYKVAEFLGVPKSIQEARPSGDMYDARYDEEVFGAPYEFVELYLLYLSLNSAEKSSWEETYLKTQEDKELFILYKNNLDALHRYNSHKYKVGSPAYHLDLEPLIYFKKDKFGWGINV